VAWLAWCLALSVSVALAAWRGVADSGPWPWALAYPLAALPLVLIRPGWRWLLGRGARAPRRLRWQGDGRWWLEEQGGWAGYVSLAAPRRLGPLVWLGGRGPRGRIHCLLDGNTMEPNALRRLQARVGDAALHRGSGPATGA
jgi:hypothetical protein